jgi:hypothetical protein
MVTVGQVTGSHAVVLLHGHAGIDESIDQLILACKPQPWTQLAHAIGSPALCPTTNTAKMTAQRTSANKNVPERQCCHGTEQRSTSGVRLATTMSAQPWYNHPSIGFFSGAPAQ